MKSLTSITYRATAAVVLSLSLGLSNTHAEILIANYQNPHQGSIFKANDDGSSLTNFIPSGGAVTLPSDLVIGSDDNLYISSIWNDTVARYDALTGAFIDVFADANNGLDSPQGMTLGQNGNLFVIHSNGRIAEFDAAGNKVADDYVTYAFDEITVAPDGRIVGRDYSGNIVAWDPVTKARTTLFNAFSGQLNAWSVEFAPDGRLFVGGSDAGYKIRVFDWITHALLDEFSTGTLASDLTFGDGNELFLGNAFWGHIEKYDTSGNHLGNILSGEVSGPIAILHRSAGGQGASQVSEPAMLWMLGIGLIGAGWRRRRHRSC